MTSLHAPTDGGVRASGHCLCGAVSYKIRGPLRPILICHCSDCRRWHGCACAATAVEGGDIEISGSDALRWYTKPSSEPLPSRGFCAQCGSSLFWCAPERSTVSIAAGTLDVPTGLRVVAHIFTSDASDYEGIGGDGLDCYERDAPPRVAAPARDD